MSAHIYVGDISYEIVGDGKAPGTTPGARKRDARFSQCYGSLGYVTLQGDTIPDGIVSEVVDILTGIYNDNQFDADELAQ